MYNAKVNKVKCVEGTELVKLTEMSMRLTSLKYKNKTRSRSLAKNNTAV